MLSVIAVYVCQTGLWQTHCITYKTAEIIGQDIIYGTPKAIVSSGLSLGNEFRILTTAFGEDCHGCDLL